ncbi:MAG: outer membrane protein transport protein, partial [Desulfobacterales bacterium]
DGDLWESFDGGDTWARTGLTGAIVNDVLIDPRNPAVLYAGCGYSGGTKAPLFKSIDGGKSWSTAAAGMPPMPTSSIAAWGFPSGSLYTAGQGNIQRFDGSTWTAILDDANVEFWGLWGVSEENLYAVGSSGTIRRFDGSVWTAMKSGSDQRLRTVWGTGGADIYAAGFGGTILHFDGISWNAMDSGTTEILYGIWGAAADAFFAVGEKGTILRCDGRSWSPMTSGTTEYLDAVWGAAPDRIFAVGGGGTILFYDGRSWTTMTSGTANGLAAVWGSSAADVYAAGERGTLLHFDGSRWTAISHGMKEKLQAIWGDSSSNVFVVGDNGGMLHFDGRSWRVLRAPGEIGQAVVDLEFHADNPDIVYAGTLNSGIFVSPNQAGRWLNLGKLEYKVFAISVGSVYAATQAGLLQCTGTGVIAGRLQNAGTREGIDGATVFTDLGVTTRSVNGEYMLVSPAGSCSVTAVADRHANQIESHVNVYGGDVTWVNLDLHSGVAGPVEDADGGSSSSRGGYSCFIAAAGGTGPAQYLVWPAALIGLIALSLVGAVFLRARRRKPARRLYFLPLFLMLTLAAAVPIDAVAGTLFQQVGIASSPNPVGSGARALGMGGAFIGVADDATAASWNPAGLIQLEKPEITIVGEYTSRSEDFSSDLRPEIANSGDIDTTSLNYFAATLPFHFYRNMVASVNYQRLYDFTREFNHRLDFTQAGLDLLQNKHFRQDGSVGALGLAGAVEITPTLSLGATVNIWTDQLLWDNGWDETFTEIGAGTIGGVPATTKTFIRDEYSRFRGLNANIGLLWNVIPALTIGAVLKTPFKASVKHTFEFRQTQTLAPPVDTVTTTSQALTEDVELEMPLSYGIGLAWRFSDALTVDVDVYRTLWSDYLLEDGRGNKFSPITGLPRDRSDVDDTTQVRLGAEYLFIFPNRQLVVPLRAGAFYDPEPAQGKTRDFYGIALGSGLAYKRLIFDVAYNFRWGNDVDTGNLITTSRADVRQHTILASLIFHL